MVQAYDTIARENLWTTLIRKVGYSNMKLIQILRSLFDFNFSFVRIHDQLGPAIYSTRGLIQGSTLSPILFNIILGKDKYFG